MAVIWTAPHVWYDPDEDEWVLRWYPEPGRPVDEPLEARTRQDAEAEGQQLLRSIHRAAAALSEWVV